MPVVPFPYAHVLLFVLAIGISVAVGHALLRRPFPRENITLMTRVPYGMVGWMQVGLYYVVAAAVYSHIDWGIEYSMLHFERVNALALVAPYLGWIASGILIGFTIVLAELVMPRKVLVTDGALVLKMRSPLFFRIPLHDIVRVEPVHTWKAWWKLLRLRALPLHPWFFRGLLIHRKSGRPVLLHTKDDDGIRAVLSGHMPFDRAAAAENGQVEPQTQGLRNEDRLCVEPVPKGEYRTSLF